MADRRLPRPNFRTASDDDIKTYFLDCLVGADEQGLIDAANELKQRGGHEDYLDQNRELAGPDIGQLF